MASITPIDAARLVTDTHVGGHDMPIGERIKTQRKAAGWSQGELAEKVGTDARQISRYENGRITPSLDVAMRIAEALNTSLDHLAFDAIPQRPLHSADNALGDQLAVLGELGADDLHLVNSFIEALVTKTRLRTLANGLG